MIQPVLCPVFYTAWLTGVLTDMNFIISTERMSEGWGDGGMGDLQE
ncbi:hypothetical protein J0895_13275 [Phormidium pseudopriestleyi FRX01]|uniref:Uncharacterized protein n=1 Tax=Phormidium pseudopriestleyi FRX01 TaxID=1759528 RepID=A0ABS3FTX9_9CYAN|nr:hypothetical protein [Phormidium pseudopriestleyi]MBO0350066.1 hypothetical protein [Phormidium pseudopriestleyi FRX01]